MPFNPDVHHRRSVRLDGYDYKKAGAYFVTLCLHRGWLNREGMTSAKSDFLLGKIVDGQTQLNEYGQVVHSHWTALPAHRQDIELDEFVIMPNHFHGMVLLGDKSVGLPQVMNGFKSFSARKINQIRKVRSVPVWQRDYYEHIIRDENDLNRIRAYIINNPAKWSEDEYHIS